MHHLANAKVKIRSVILLVCALFFGIVAQAESSIRHHAIAGKHIMLLSEDEPDAQDFFEDSFLVLTEIHAQRPCRIRSRFYAPPTWFIISNDSKTDEVTITDSGEIATCPLIDQKPELPFYYLFLFRLTPF